MPCASSTVRMANSWSTEALAAFAWLAISAFVWRLTSLRTLLMTRAFSIASALLCAPVNARNSRMALPLLRYTMNELRRCMTRALMPLRSSSSTRPSAKSSLSTVISKWKSPRGSDTNPLPRKAPRR